METPSYLQRRLVQNYYEIHGTFDGIISTPMGDEVFKFANETKRTVEEACYNFLGYNRVSNFSAKEIAQLRAKAIYDNESYEKYKALVGEKEAAQLIRPSKVKSLARDKQLIFDLCYAHFSNCCHTIIDIGENSFEFSKHLNYLRQLRVSPATVFTALSEAKGELRYLKSSVREACVYNNVCVADVDITAAEFTRICQKAITAVLYGKTANLKFACKNLEYLAVVGLEDTALYTNLLDIALANNITYSELLKEIGVHIGDYVSMFPTLKCIKIPLEDGLYLTIDQTCSNGTKYVKGRY